MINTKDLNTDKALEKTILIQAREERGSFFYTVSLSSLLKDIFEYFISKQKSVRVIIESFILHANSACQPIHLKKDRFCTK